VPKNKKMRKILLLSIVIISTLLSSCSNDDNKKEERLLPSSSGRMNEMVVVMKHDLWRGKVGKQVRDIFQQDVVGLPQPEPIYRIAHIDPIAFTSTFKAARNLFIVRINKEEKAKLSYKGKIYAQPQEVIELSANSEETLLVALKKYKNDIVKKFHDQDIKSVQKRFRRIKIQKIPDLADKGISITIPKSFAAIDFRDNFWWYRSDIRQGKHYPSLNLLLYITPMKSEFDLSGQDIISTRDSIGKAFIGGAIDGSYMQTEHRPQYAPIMKNTLIDGKIAIETRGLWMIKGDFMGGPFVSYTIFDDKNKRIITAEGFVYGAGVKKRDLVFEIEAIIKSLKITN
jgi:hypothetical protein